MAEQSLYGDVTFTLNAYTPTLKITVTGHQSYSSITGNDPWALNIYLDGNVIATTGGSGAATETPILVGIARSVGGGNHTLRVTWSANSNMVFKGDTTTIEASFK